MSTQSTTVRMFGALHTFRKEHGLESTTQVCIPEQGCAARDLACQLDLPLEKIEAVFINHRAYDLGHVIQQGDRVAFVPTGIPVHSRCLGVFGAGRQSRRPADFQLRDREVFQVAEGGIAGPEVVDGELDPQPVQL